MNLFLQFLSDIFFRSLTLIKIYNPLVMKFILATLLSFIFLACVQKPELHSFSGGALGTSYNVQFYGEKPFPVQEKFDSVVAAVNHSMSTYIPSSDISKINRGDSSVVVDSMFKEVLSLAQRIYKTTDGYYDPTVGVLVNAYGFGPGKRLKVLDSAHIDSLKQFVGLDKINLSPQGKINMDKKGMYLDFNSIAKGYCIDRIGTMLEANGITDYLVEMGGELRARGTNLGKKAPWTVGIENIDAPVDDRSYTKTVALIDKGMAGSGNYRKFRVDSVTGERYVHTINPITGLATRSNVLSSTVLAATCAKADGYATAFMALGLERSKKVLDTLDDVDAYLLYDDQKGGTAVYMSRGFGKFLN